MQKQRRERAYWWDPMPVSLETVTEGASCALSTGRDASLGACARMRRLDAGPEAQGCGQAEGRTWTCCRDALEQTMKDQQKDQREAPETRTAGCRGSGQWLDFRARSSLSSPWATPGTWPSTLERCRPRWALQHTDLTSDPREDTCKTGGRRVASGSTTTQYTRRTRRTSRTRSKLPEIGMKGPSRKRIQSHGMKNPARSPTSSESLNVLGRGSTGGKSPPEAAAAAKQKNMSPSASEEAKQ